MFKIFVLAMLLSGEGAILESKEGYATLEACEAARPAREEQIKSALSAALPIAELATKCDIPGQDS